MKTCKSFSFKQATWSFHNKQKMIDSRLNSVIHHPHQHTKGFKEKNVMHILPP